MIGLIHLISRLANIDACKNYCTFPVRYITLKLFSFSFFSYR